MNHQNDQTDSDIVELRNTQGASSVVLVCEHASSYIPPKFNNLGVAEEALLSHVAWDPGAMAVAEAMSDRLDARLIAARTSRLVYDCNRPPEAPDAMPTRTEPSDVPGNASLTDEGKAERVATYYEPFHIAVAQVIAAATAPIIVTIHSFTHVYYGVTRDVEIGILHDTDARLADAMLSCAPTAFDVRRNEPYSPEDGVTHTLKRHAIPPGHLNVMIEIRSDLIANPSEQSAMAETMSDWLETAINHAKATS